LRELPETRQAFLVAISGYGQSEDLEQSKSAGFDRHLLKPVDPLRLSDLLMTVMKQT
jgi:CheY-like chemotaxis protein